MELDKIHLYRMTHIENVPHILRYGITHKNSPHADAAYKSIGDASLISTRETKRVCIDNGTFHQEGENIVLGEFIPFYFGIRMPMLYVIQHGGNFVPQATPPTDIIYLVCHLLSVANAQSRCYLLQRSRHGVHHLFLRQIPHPGTSLTHQLGSNHRKILGRRRKAEPEMAKASGISGKRRHSP